MDDPNRKKSFARSLRRFESTGKVNQEDCQAIPKLGGGVEPNRREHPVPANIDRPYSLQQFFKSVPADTYDSLDEGLRQKGWSKMPHGEKELGRGAYGRVTLAMRAADPRPLESKQLVAVKVSRLIGDDAATRDNYKAAWFEISALRACVHPNIVAYFGHFFIVPRSSELGAAALDEKHSEVVIVMEYGNAGTLFNEMLRFPEGYIPERHARYYMKQILEGVKYLHSCWIIHKDLHPDNILLKYNADFSKTCLLMDFGICEFVPTFNRTGPALKEVFKENISCIMNEVVLKILVGVNMYGEANPVNFKVLSPSAYKMIFDPPKATIDQALKAGWFSLPAKAYIGEQPAPLVAATPADVKEPAPRRLASDDVALPQFPPLAHLQQLDPTRDTMGYRPRLDMGRFSPAAAPVAGPSGVNRRKGKKPKEPEPQEQGARSRTAIIDARTESGAVLRAEYPLPVSSLATHSFPLRQESSPVRTAAADETASPRGRRVAAAITESLGNMAVSPGRGSRPSPRPNGAGARPKGTPRRLFEGE